jgi:hypothetical protein
MRALFLPGQTGEAMMHLARSLVQRLASRLGGGQDGGMSTPPPLPEDLLERLGQLAQAATPPQGKESSAESIQHLVELKRATTPEVVHSLVEEVRQGRRRAQLPPRPGVEQLLVRK